MRQVVISFLNMYDFSDKKVIPFCTHDGYGAGRSYSTIAAASKAKNTANGLSIEAKNVPSAKSTVVSWLNSIGISKSSGSTLQTAIKIKIGETVLDGALHLGFHWGMIVGMIFRKISKGKKSSVIFWIMRAAALAVSVYGAVCFIKTDIFSYMFLKNEFAFFDFEKSAISVFAEYIAMMALWIFIGHYMAKGLGKLGTIKRKDPRNEEN